MSILNGGLLLLIKFFKEINAFTAVVYYVSRFSGDVFVTH